MRKLLLVLLLCLPAAAQQFDATKFSFVTSVTVNSGGGAYVTPKVIVTAEPKYTYDKWGFGGSLNLIPTGKIDTRDGATLSERFEVFAVAGETRIGAGISHSNTWTSDYTKQANHPYLYFGDTDPYGQYDINVRYFLPQGDRRNGLTGPEFTFDFKLKGHLWLRLRGDIYSIYPTDAPQLGRKLYSSGGGGVVGRW